MNNYEFCAAFAEKLYPDRSTWILDYGCGGGQIIRELRKLGYTNTFGCDVFYEGGSYKNDPLAAEYLTQNVIQEMKGSTIPFSDNRFQLVINNQVLEHVEDLNQVLGEMHRVLVPGGMVLSLFPDKGVWREGHCGIPFLHWFPKGTHSRIYFAAFFRSLGLGYFKKGKTIFQWSRDFCDWLDKWTYYRPYREIRRSFDQLFCHFRHQEDYWLDQRLGKRRRLASAFPAGFKRLVVRKLAGMIFTCEKAKAPIVNGPLSVSHPDIAHQVDVGSRSK